jgi:putative membrane protein
VSGVEYQGDWLPFLGVAVLFGAVNAFIAPLAKIVTFPLIILTLGAFLLVINALMLWLTGTVAAAFGIGFVVSGFWPAFWGGLVVSIVSTLLGVLVTDGS